MGIPHCLIETLVGGKRGTEESQIHSSIAGLSSLILIPDLLMKHRCASSFMHDVILGILGMEKV